jgi:hypothetical protein
VPPATAIKKSCLKLDVGDIALKGRLGVSTIRLLASPPSPALSPT